MTREILGDPLREHASLRREQDHRNRGRNTQDGFHGLEDWFWLHHHPAAAPVRRVVGGVMPVVRIVADVVHADVDQSTLASALKNTGFEIRGKHFRQEGKHLELHY